MNAACPKCHGALFFHVVEAESPADRGLLVHAIGLPQALRAFRGSVPSEIPCPHCGAAVAVPRWRAAAVDAILGVLDGDPLQ